jgi:hypothetical protein
MASNVHVSATGRNAQLAALAALCNGGTIKFYDGAQPASAGVAITSQNLLCTLTFGGTAYGSPSAGSVTANAIASGVIGASGTVAWARVYESDGVTVVLDCSVGTSSADIIVPTVTFTAGVTVTMSSNTMSIAA